MAVGREDLGSAVLELVTDPTKLRAGMAAARAETTKTLNDANGALRNIGTKMTATGGQMTRGVTVPVLAAGAAIVSVGADFEHTMSQIVGLVGISREQVNAWKPEIEALAKSTGIGPVELAKGLYFVASSGIDASKAMGVLTTAARASEAGMGDVAMLADVLTGTMMAYGKSNLSAAHTMDVLVRGIQVGKAEPADFAASLGTIAPVAAQLGVKVEDLVGTMAVLSRVNSNVAENATSLGQVMNTLLKPSAQTNEALSKIGLTAADLRKELSEKGLLAVLKTLGEHIGDDDTIIAHIFPNIRALRGVLNLTGQDATSVSEAMAKVADSSGALDDAVKAVADDAQIKMNKALASMQVELIVLSADVLPAVVKMLSGVVSGVHDAVTWFSNLPGPVKTTIVQGLGLLAILGPILVILGSIITAGTAVVGAFASIANVLFVKLIPMLVRLALALVAASIEGLATAIFATGIPALEALGVALVGVESAAGPLLAIAAAVIAIGVAASGASPSIDEVNKKILDLKNEGGIIGFFDFGKQGQIDVLKKSLQDMASAEAAAAAKERADLLERQKAWDDWRTGVKTTLGVVANDIGAGGVPDAIGGMVGDIEDGLRSGKYKVQNGAIVMAAPIAGETAKSGANAVKAVTTSIGDIARAIRAGRQTIVDAMNDVVNEAYDPLILKADIAATKTELAQQAQIASTKAYSQAEIDAAKKHAKTDAQRRAADKMQTQAQIDEAKRRVLELKKQLATELNDQTKYGTDAQRLALLAGRGSSKELIAGLKSGDTARKKASQAAASDIASEIIALEGKMGTYGTRTGNSYIDGLVKAFEERSASVKRAFAGLSKFFEASSPPGPESPLHLIDQWGYRTGETYIYGMADALAAGRSAIRRHLGGIAGDLASSTDGSGSLGRIERMGTIRVEHVLDDKTAAALASAGFSAKEVGQALADGVNASGLFGHLQGLQAMSGS